MLRWSEVRYARANDGALVAYQVRGVGPPLLLLLDGFVPIEDMDDEPRLAGALRRLSGLGRTIRFDRRGIGLSDPGGSAEPSLERWLDDAEAVLVAEGYQRGFVFGERGGALIALALAALRPERVRGLVLVNGFAKFLAGPDHPVGTDPAFMDEVRERLFDPHHPSGPFDIVGHLAPSAVDDARFREWWDRSGRRGASPATARALRHAIETLDVRGLLPQVHAPTVVVHREGAATPPVGQGKFIAAQVPHSTFVPVEGDDGLWYVGDVAPVIDAARGVIDVDDVAVDDEGEILTILFTDIVASTRRASSSGDAEWARIFDAYENAAYRFVTKYAGSYIKSTGDGSLALFETASAAVECAIEIRDAATALGLDLRCGIHTGTVRLRGRDVAGLAVHVAARLLGIGEVGEVLLTASAAEGLAGSPVSLEDRGEVSLRGVEGKWPLFALS